MGSMPLHLTPYMIRVFLLYLMLHLIGRVQVDDGGVVWVMDDAAFMSGRDDIVRYHASGVTVSRMEDAGGLVSMRVRGLRYSSKQ